MDHTHGVHLLLGARCSMFTTRVRSYLVKKNIDHIERVPGGWTYLVRIRRRFGQSTIPIVITPAGEWLVDSNLILDRLERDFPVDAVTPPDPVHALFDRLFDAWASEMWLPAIMATRWLAPEINYPIWREEVGEGFFVGLPKFLKNTLVDRIARTFSGYLPTLGVSEATWPVLEIWLNAMLDALDAHLSTRPYILGDRATRADFALTQPLYCHLVHDPSGRPYLRRRPHAQAWAWRMFRPYESEPAPPLPEPGQPLPTTLDPIVRSFFDEMLPLAEATLDALRPTLARATPGKPLPRRSREIEYPLGDSRHRKQGFVILLWYLQRALDLVAAMPPADAVRCQEWLDAAGGQRLLQLKIPRLRLLAGTTLALD